MKSSKRTPLYDMHLKHNGMMVDFAGYELPIQYTSISDEHTKVRNEAGLFDVSHMGEVEVVGAEAEAFVQYLVTNDVKTLENNQVLYTMMCYENGTVVDDLLVYRYEKNHFLLVINAANVAKDVAWIERHADNYDLEVKNISNEISQLALQGPKAQEILQKLVTSDLSEITFFHFDQHVEIKGIKTLISRTGYTGEDGFEIYCQNEDASKLWQYLIECGQEEISPIGLGARDTLRFEACLPLYGHEISDEITPLEAGLKMFVKLETDDFIGKNALLDSRTDGVKRKLVGIQLDKGIAREGAIVMIDDQEIGYVTTGYKSPTLGSSIALALIKTEHGKMGNLLQVKVRKKIFTAKIISKRFYKKNYKK